MDPETYCREVEAYLCRKNDGHLIRIVGPSFERVCRWDEQGIPIKIVFRGIDRYFERYYAKGPRRRPVHIDFCEADILDVFDEWRRAVGVAHLTSGSEEEPAESGRRHASLPAHLERVIARLTALRAGSRARLPDKVLERIVRTIDTRRASARSVRGEARARMIAELAVLDAELMVAVRATCDASELQVLSREAEDELSPFRVRMPADAFARAHAACVERLLRERHGLPTIAYEA